MKNRLKLILLYFIFWYIVFVIARIAFLIVYFKQTQALSFTDIFSTFFFGFKLDASIASYVAFIPCLLLIVTVFGTTPWLKYFYHTYTYLTILLFTSIIIGDLVLYQYWHFRMDATPLFYLKNIKAATASVSTLTVIGGIFVILLVSGLLCFAYSKIFNPLFKNLKSPKSLVFLLPLLALLGLTIRGGWGISALNVSSAYFSDKPFANHAAVNPVWNVGSGLFEADDLQKEYKYFLPKEAETYLNCLFKQEANSNTRLLNAKRPNIILVIVESLTAKVVAHTGGDTLIMPEFNKLIKEGVFFNNVYATADRTDRGLAGTISSFPSLPGSSPLKYPKITEKLPSITKELKNEGYNTLFMYGGTLEFANYKTFLLQAGYEKLISEKDFPKNKIVTKWGVYDETLFNKAVDEINQSRKPFFATLLTLTSHDPFTIPIEPLFKGNSTEIKYLNSLHYTDRCIGNFVKQAKQQAWWNNTLLVFIADHGSQFPGNSEAANTDKYHIPMLWIGGTLKNRDTVVSSPASQIDLTATLLRQLNMPTDKFKFSRDIFSVKNHFAFFTHSEGLGFIDSADTVFYNTISNVFSKTSPNKDKNNQAKAYLQYVFECTKQMND